MKKTPIKKKTATKKKVTPQKATSIKKANPANAGAEILKSSTVDKKTYFYVNSSKGINQLSREVFIKSDIEIHYPIGYEGGDKYKNIKSIHFQNFASKLPVGINKSYSKGYGFTRPLKPFAKYIDIQLKIKKIIVKKGAPIAIHKTTGEMTLNEEFLKSMQLLFSELYKKSTAETNLTLLNFLHDRFPSVISKPPKKYVANALSTTLANWGNKIDEFSPKDKTAIKDLFEKLSLDTNFLTSANLAKTKMLVDNKYIAQTIKSFDDLMLIKKHSTSLEKKWQLLLKENSWIFSSIFSHPVILFQDEAYVGGKSIQNKDGKFNDFLIKNSLSDNVSFLELKTNQTLLLEPKPYRGSDVFCATKELTGCINQVLNQRDLFQKEFDGLRRKSDETFETLNSKCVVLIGTFSSMTVKQKQCFELFRSNSRDVEIITFDELLTKMKSLQHIMTKK